MNTWLKSGPDLASQVWARRGPYIRHGFATCRIPQPEGGPGMRQAWAMLSPPAPAFFFLFFFFQMILVETQYTQTKEM